MRLTGSDVWCDFFDRRTASAAMILVALVFRTSLAIGCTPRFGLLAHTPTTAAVIPSNMVIAALYADGPRGPVVSNADNRQVPLDFRLANLDFHRPSSTQVFEGAEFSIATRSLLVLGDVEGPDNDEPDAPTLEQVSKERIEECQGVGYAISVDYALPFDAQGLVLFDSDDEPCLLYTSPSPRD